MTLWYNKFISFCKCALQGHESQICSLFKHIPIPLQKPKFTKLFSGSDVLLEEVNRILGGSNEVTLTLSDNNESGEFLAKLVMKSHNQWGATYILSGPLAVQYNAVGFELWICNVTHDVMGEHHRSIYIHNFS